MTSQEKVAMAIDDLKREALFLPYVAYGEGGYAMMMSFWRYLLSLDALLVAGAVLGSLILGLVLWTEIIIRWRD